MKAEVKSKLRILLVDDHTLFREGLRRLLDGESGVAVCGDFESADAALREIERGIKFDLALVDYELTVSGGKTTNGLDLLRQMRVLRPNARVLFVTAGMNLTDLCTAVTHLNAGIFLKTEPIAVSSGVALALLSKHEAEIAQQQSRERLSERENLVLRGVLEGLTNKEIGARMELTESSVKAVLQKLFEKTGVRSRSQLVRYAIEAQIVAK